jgi:hypothetical protein
MIIEQFVDNDKAYLSWRNVHPGGFVANVSARGRSYVMLHKVSHNLSNRGSSHPNSHTHTYMKIASEDLTALVAAVVALGNSPGIFRDCKICLLGTANRFKPIADPQLLSEATSELLATGIKPEYPEGYNNPRVTPLKTQEYYRCPRVRAWVLWQAQGQCECCKGHAPFTDSRGMPYLEPHHIISLSAKGPDVVDNCVALCPNGCTPDITFGFRENDGL